MMVARGLGEGRMENYCPVSTELKFGEVFKFWRWMVVVTGQPCDMYLKPLNSVHKNG